MIVEFFSCSGGMAEGFRRAGLPIDMAFDKDKDAVQSYQHNLGHAPVQMDVRDLRRMVEGGWRPSPDGEPLELVVADPPCTPWSRAGKRRGMKDERDMLLDTVVLIELLQPMAYLIGNVPGLDDSPNQATVDQTIGRLGRVYCQHYRSLNAVDFGVPQRRQRPFWYGHRCGLCIEWPEPTHVDPGLARQRLISGEFPPAHVTCRVALQHLTLKDLGKPVRLRERRQNGKEHGSVPDKPARVVGTSNLSDGNVLLVNHRHPPLTLDQPAHTLGAKDRGAQGGNVLIVTPKHPPSELDEPARTIVASDATANGRILVTGRARHPNPNSDADAPAKTIGSRARGAQGSDVLRGLASAAPLGPKKARKHPPSRADEPAKVIPSSQPNNGGAVLEWPTARSTLQQADQPAYTITSAGRGHTGAAVMEWPWERPATTICADERLAPAGHHGGSFLSTVTAIKLSEKAAAILQGFPDGWKFCGKTKASRWSQIGQAMPPALAEAVAIRVRIALRTAPHAAVVPSAVEPPKAKPPSPQAAATPIHQADLFEGRA